jgi:uncharacterized protein (TIGR02594 family)
MTIKTPPWLQWARNEIGTREIIGTKHNPRVVAYWRQGNVALNVSDDETPWCAAFVAAALEQTLYRSTRSGMARSYANSPHFTRIEGPRLGAICVLSSSRGPSSGHVGFVEAANDTHVWLLGGNQSNAVNVARFPLSLLVGYFRPLTYATPLPTCPRVPPGSALTSASDA